MKIRNHILLYFACLSLLVQACVPKLPEYKNAPNENLDVPKEFPEATDNSAEISTQKSWKLFFQDEQLKSLIEIALKKNQEINILNQEINIANNEVLAKKGSYLPKLGISAGYNYDKVGEFTSQGKSDKLSGLSDKLHNRQVSLNSSWEVDIWKKLRNSAKSSYYEYLASIEGRNFAITELVAEIADDYYELMALDNQLEIVEKYIENLKRSQEVVELQKAAGRATSLAVKRFNAELLKNQSREYEIKQKITVTENHLNTLLGRVPQHIKRSSKNFLDIPTQNIATDIPAALLENRPDIRQAALKIKAAKLNVKSVKAQFYPSLNIDSSVGYQAFNSQHFLDTPSSLVYNIAGGISAPLLNRKAIKADYFSANNKQIEAVYDYEQTFIKAFAEVANQLAYVNNLKEIYSLKTKQTKALSQSFEISNVLFRAARVTYLESLLTRRDYLESQLELIEVKERQLLTYVNLYKALGGGWRDEETKSNHS